MARMAVVASMLAIAGWATGGHATPPATPTVVLADGAFSQSNSRDGQAILSAADMAPGAVAEGTVTIANTGTTGAVFTLVRSAASGPLAGALQLVVEDLSAGELAYAGPLMQMGSRTVGRFAPGESRDFRFRVRLPDGDATLAGASAGVTFRWLAEHNDQPVQPQPTRPSTGDNGTNPTPPPPPPPTPAGRPRLTLTAAAKQRVLRQRAVIVTASCDQACSLRADGTVTERGSKALRRLAPVTRRLAAGGRTKLRVKLSRASKKAVQAALRKRRKVSVNVRVTATSASGQSTTVSRLIRVKR